MERFYFYLLLKGQYYEVPDEQYLVLMVLELIEPLIDELSSVNSER